MNSSSYETHPSLSPKQVNRQNQYYLYDPALLTRHLKARPPKEAYLFFPRKDDQVILNPKKPEKTLRMIFTNVEFTDYENRMLEAFYSRVDFLNKKNPTKKLILPKWWKESDTRRFLQATSFTIDKSIEYIRQQITWRESFFPFTINDHIIEILNSEFMYIYGRDSHFRPIFVVKASTFFQLRDKYTFDEMFMAIVYFLEYVINNLLILGQIENWTMITDITGVSLVFMPSELKKIINILSSCYRCRLFRNYIIGMNSALRFIAKIFMSFLDQATVNKIRFLDEGNKYSELTTFINDNNLQKKYGGNAPDLVEGDNNVFPPCMPSDSFSKEGDEVLIKEDEYKERCIGKGRRPAQICQEFIEKWEKENKEKEEEEERRRLSMINKSKTSFHKSPLDDLINQNEIKMSKSNKEQVVKSPRELVVQSEFTGNNYLRKLNTSSSKKKCLGASRILGMNKINFITPDIFGNAMEVETILELNSEKTDLSRKKLIKGM